MPLGHAQQTLVGMRLVALVATILELSFGLRLGDARIFDFLLVYVFVCLYQQQSQDCGLGQRLPSVLAG